MANHNNRDNLEFPFYGTNFLRDHAGHIISDPKVAITELIANCYDAGATAVAITWPDDNEGAFVISDNGTGMTLNEFERRWRTLSYDRLKEQGPNVEFPPGVQKRHRTAFGRNGKGRHAAFCFADTYEVETRKAFHRLIAEVSLTEGGDTPFRCVITLDQDSPELAPGTNISAHLTRGMMTQAEILEVIGNRFIVDPSFSIELNGQPVKLLELQALSTSTIDVPPYGKVNIHILDAITADKSTKLKGLTWWVNDRMVGEPSWEGLEGNGSILDGRTSEAKRFSFIIQANMLREEVKADWSGFHATARWNAISKQVRQFVMNKIYEARCDERKARKITALEENRELLRELPEQSKQLVAHFVEEVQEKCPKLSPHDLAQTVEIYAKLEQSRSGYDLLKQLAACSPDDLDSWNIIMQKWTATNANVVLNELGERLALLSKLQSLINNRKTDELHELQPLFDRGLWMFGPEYEAVDFRSNKGMSEVIRRFFKVPDAPASQRRPDLIALSDASIGVYAADDYDSGGEAFGHRKVLIVELKRGDFTITNKELDQARDYIEEMRSAGCFAENTIAEAYVLGTRIKDGVSVNKTGTCTEMKPMTYANLLKRAHARTFQLHSKLEKAQPADGRDPELSAVLAFNDPMPLFTNGVSR